MNSFMVDYVNDYGHIIYSFRMEGVTEKEVIKAAKNGKVYYPECYIEILNLDTLKRIYA